jgi:dienelactone hydrolase
MMFSSRTILAAAAVGALAAVLAACAGPAPSVPPTAVPAGEVKGSATRHTPASSQGVIANAQVALPAPPGGKPFLGKWPAAGAAATGRYPVVLFMHGSSGLGLAAIGEWQRALAEMGIASVAPDSFALPDRLTYKSPVAKDVYERIHALRASEIAIGLEALRSAPWADPSRVVLAGTSEGAVAVARFAGPGLAGRMMYAWSCEDNYMVEAHRTAVPVDQPVLNVISSADPFFSRSNSYLGAPQALGHCGGTLAQHKSSTVVLIAGAPHTLLNLPAARHATAGFLRDVLRP